MRVKLLLLGALLIGLPALAGCTDLNKIDLSSEIPLTAFMDKTGANVSIVSDSDMDVDDSQRFARGAPIFWKLLRPADLIGMNTVNQTFWAGGRRFTFALAVGRPPAVYDADGFMVPVTIESHDEDGHWNNSIRLSLENAGERVGCEETFTLTFPVPGIGRICEIRTQSWSQIEIGKDSATYVDSFGNTISYDYPKATRKWGVSASVGIRYYQKGTAVFSGDQGDLTLEAVVWDADLDGYITDRDKVRVRAYTKGGTVGGPVGDNLPFNSFIPVSRDYGYVLTLRPDFGPDGEHYTLVVQRQAR